MSCVLISFLVSLVVSVFISTRFNAMKEKEHQEFLLEIKNITLDVLKEHFRDEDGNFVRGIRTGSKKGTLKAPLKNEFSISDLTDEDIEKIILVLKSKLGQSWCLDLNFLLLHLWPDHKKHLNVETLLYLHLGWWARHFPEQHIHHFLEHHCYR